MFFNLNNCANKGQKIITPQMFPLYFVQIFAFYNFLAKICTNKSENFLCILYGQQDNYHHYINIMISLYYHLVASPPISWQKPSEAFAWLAAWCPHSDRGWFVLFWILFFPRGQAGRPRTESKVFTFFQTAAQVWEKAGRAWSDLRKTAVIIAITLPHLD